MRKINPLNELHTKHTIREVLAWNQFRCDGRGYQNGRSGLQKVRADKTLLHANSRVEEAFAMVSSRRRLLYKKHCPCVNNGEGLTSSRLEPLITYDCIPEAFHHLASKVVALFPLTSFSLAILPSLFINCWSLCFHLLAIASPSKRADGHWLWLLNWYCACLHLRTYMLSVLLFARDRSRIRPHLERTVLANPWWSSSFSSEVVRSE